MSSGTFVRLWLQYFVHRGEISKDYFINKDHYRSADMKLVHIKTQFRIQGRGCYNWGLNSPMTCELAKSILQTIFAYNPNCGL